MASWSPSRGIPDLSGRVALVTGASTGLGFAAATELARHNSHVIVTARKQDRADEAAAKIKADVKEGGKVEGLELDLGSFKSIHKAAEAIKAKGTALHILIANAGVFCPPHSKTQEGFEVTVGSAYIGHILLIQMLLPLLKQSAPSRVVIVSGSAEASAELDWEDIGSERASSSGFGQAAKSTALRILAARELNKRHAAEGVTVFACHPGIAATEAFNKMEKTTLFSTAAGMVFSLIAQSAAKGAYSMLYAATSPQLEGTGGRYFGPNHFNCGNTAERAPKNKYDKNPSNWARAYDGTTQLIASKRMS